DANNKKYIEFNSTYCELSANTLTMKDAFVTAYGNNFTLIVKNYSGFTIETNITSTATAKIGEEPVGAVVPEITPPTAQIATGKSGDFVVTCEPIIPQETTLTLQFEEYAEPFTFYQYSDYTAEGSWLGNQKLTAPAARDANTHYEYFCTFGTYPQSWCETTPDTTGLGTTSSSYSGVEVTFYQDSNTKEYKYAQVNGNYYAFEPIRWIVLGVDTSGSIAFNGDGGATTTVDTANTSSILFTDALADAGKLKIENNRIYYDENGNSTFEDGEKQTNLLLLSELALDCEYFDADYGTNQWSKNNDCDVKLFLNNFNGSSMTDFATISGLGKYYATEQNTNLIQRTNIKTTTYVSNSTSGNDNGYYNMFLLGSNRNSNSGYKNNYTDSYNIASYFPIYTGTGTGASGYIDAIMAKVTPFAVASHHFANGGSATSNTLGFSSWWLRSGYYGSTYDAYAVGAYQGSVDHYDVGTDYGRRSVRPSFILNLA
ncbi:MAG: hypothetical protein IJA22_02720, partial [Clostridia bacterium]|nr:hypothetical protein [Clostridia bacterium]